MGQEGTNILEKGPTDSNQVLVNSLLEMVREFHKTFFHPVGMIQWNTDYGIPGGLSKQRTMLRAALIQEELNELREGCLNHDWERVLDGIGDLEYVLLGTVAELGISVDTLLETNMIEGFLSLDLRAIPMEVRQ